MKNTVEYVPMNNLKLKYLLTFLKKGIIHICVTPLVRCRAILFLVGEALFLKFFKLNVGMLSAFFTFWYKFAGFALSALFAYAYTIWAGMPKGFISIMQNLSRSGLTNAQGEPPFFKGREPKRDGPGEVWTFESIGIAQEEWSRYLPKLETAWDAAISFAEPGENEHETRLHLVEHPGPWPSVIPWDDSYLPSNHTTLALGENRGQPITIDLTSTPHLSISARTGGGKSILLQNLMYQGNCKGMQIVLIDYKGGLDYSAWKNHVEILHEDQVVVDKMTELLWEHHRRTGLLYQANCPNIRAYNQEHPDEQFPDILVIVDELTECLDKSGATKERKEMIDAISLSLSSLARLARATGIHLVLAQQRGSADILPGSVRNNVFKIIGQCDENLAILTMGTADAARRIPPTAHGRFIDENGIMFQGYYQEITEDDLNLVFGKWEEVVVPEHDE